MKGRENDQMQTSFFTCLSYNLAKQKQSTEANVCVICDWAMTRRLETDC